MCIYKCVCVCVCGHRWQCRADAALCMACLSPLRAWVIISSTLGMLGGLFGCSWHCAEQASHRPQNACVELQDCSRVVLVRGSRYKVLTRYGHSYTYIYICMREFSPCERKRFRWPHRSGQNFQLTQSASVGRPFVQSIGGGFCWHMHSGVATDVAHQTNTYATAIIFNPLTM